MANTWDSHIVELEKSGKISKAAILAKDGGSVWTASKDFNLSPDERRDIASFFKTKSAADEAEIKTGVYLANAKYFTVTTSEDTVTLRKSGDGALFVMTTQAIIVALYEAPIQAAEASVAAHHHATYLRSLGY